MCFLLSGFKGALTLEALEKHNESVGGFTEASMQDDSASLGGTTFNTWATNLTGCTNATFRGIHRYINSNSSVQKEVNNLTKSRNHNVLCIEKYKNKTELAI